MSKIYLDTDTAILLMNGVMPNEGAFDSFAEALRAWGYKEINEASTLKDMKKLLLEQNNNLFLAAPKAEKFGDNQEFLNSVNEWLSENGKRFNGLTAINIGKGYAKTN